MGLYLPKSYKKTNICVISFDILSALRYPIANNIENYCAQLRLQPRTALQLRMPAGYLGQKTKIFLINGCADPIGTMSRSASNLQVRAANLDISLKSPESTPCACHAAKAMGQNLLLYDKAGRAGASLRVNAENRPLQGVQGSYHEKQGPPRHSASSASTHPLPDILLYFTFDDSIDDVAAYRTYGSEVSADSDLHGRRTQTAGLH